MFNSVLSSHVCFVCSSVVAGSDHSCSSLVTGGWAGGAAGRVFWFLILSPGSMSCVLISLALGPRRLISASLDSLAHCLGSSDGRLLPILEDRRKYWNIGLPFSSILPLSSWFGLWWWCSTYSQNSWLDNPLLWLLLFLVSCNCSISSPFRIEEGHGFPILIASGTFIIPG